jgi:hypothetical protein
MISLPGLGLSLIFTIAMCVHVVRTNRPLYWVWIMVITQGIGALIYFLAIVLPELFAGKTARKLGSVARDTLDPDRDYRNARLAHEDSPTVANAIRLAAAAAALGRPAEAEALYDQAARGVHADDPTLLLGRANALIELSRAGEALPILQRLEGMPEGRTPQVSLALGRAHEALGEMTQAEAAYDYAAGRLPGMEALARYAAFLAHIGRRAEAQEQLAEIDRRIKRADPYFRKEARAWRELAARAVG